MIEMTQPDERGFFRIGKARTRLQALKIATTSVVDHASSAVQVGGEGWLVRKAADPKENPMPTAPTTVTKADIWRQVEALGAQYRDERAAAGETVTIEKSIEHVSDDPANRDVLDQYRSAEHGPAPVAKVWTPSLGALLIQKLNAQAGEIRKARRCSASEALDLAEQTAEGREIVASVQALDGRNDQALRTLAGR